MNLVKCCILFLLLKVVSSDAFETRKSGIGFNDLMGEMHKHAIARSSTNYNTKWIVQRLDNFDDREKQTWKMKYIEHLEYFKQNGPIYLFIGGEGPIQDGFGSCHELAMETHGAVFMSEHRYYGVSIPSANLKYLSSEQALADLAHLIKTIKSQPQFRNSKVVAVGGSYPGNLAAWMRAKYPNLVDCAWASSAPVLAKKDFTEYIEQVGENFMKYGGNECYKLISIKFSNYHRLLQTAEGIEQLKREHGICKITDMTKPLNKANFILAKISKFMYAAQRGNFSDIRKICNEMMIEKHNSVDSEHGLLNLIDKQSIKYESKIQCQDYEFNNLHAEASSITWIYQTCTEFGYFQTTNSKNHPFSNDLILDYYTQMCSLLFGPYFNELTVDNAVAHTNKNYGGLSPLVTKVVFVHGSMDPWHRLGITKSLSKDVLAIMIDGTSHCADLMPYYPSEPKELTIAKAYVKKTIKFWLGLDLPSSMTGGGINSI